MRVSFSVSWVILCFLVFSSFSQGVVITELYRDPPGSEMSLCGGLSNEFIEITNLGTDTFYIDDLFITDGTEADSVISWDIVLPCNHNAITGRRFLSPGQTALILDPDYLKAVQENPTCSLNVDSGAVLLRCGDSELGRDGLAGDDGVILYKGTRSQMDSIVSRASDPMAMPDSPVSGKIVLSQPSNMEGVSVVSRSLLFDTVYYDYCSSLSTPGRLEGIKNGWLVESKFIRSSSSSTVLCSLACLKVAGEPSTVIPWALEQVSDQGGTKIITRGNLVAGVRKNFLQFELRLQIVDYRFVLDKEEWLIDLSKIWSPSSSIKINEIFPRAVSGEPEWIELVNGSSMTVNIRSWRLGNSEDTVEILSTNDYLMEPGGYVVITKDKKSLNLRYPGLKTVIESSVWHSLDNFKDTVFLWDSHGFLRDTVRYENGWFDDWAYQSLERTGTDKNGFQQNSWALSSHPTPGYPNGVLGWRASARPSMEMGPVPFTPDGDGRDDLLLIHLSVPASRSVELSIYSFDGRRACRFTGSAKESYYWDGKESNGKPVQPGPFFVVARFKSASGDVLIRKKGVLWR